MILLSAFLLFAAGAVLSLIAGWRDLPARAARL